MIKVISILFSLCLVFCAVESTAQDNIQTLYSLARQAKDNGEDKKAIEYFEELYDKTFSDAYYKELFELYNKQQNFNESEKLLKKRIRKFPENIELWIDKGYLTELQDDTKEAEKSYDEALSLIDKTDRQTRPGAYQFIKYKKYSYAEEVYLKARKLQRNDKLYRFDLASIYAQQGKTTEMVDEYLSAVGDNRSYLQSVQNLLQRVLNPDPDNIQRDRLKNQLLQKIQQNPDKEVFSELLIWLFIQDKNFNGAFIQAKALDRKMGENGKRIYSLGELSLSNKAYEVAESSFQYVINLGKESPYYLRSKMKLVDVLHEKVTVGNNYTREDLQKLKTAYEKTIKELGKSSVTSPLMRGLAEINAYYLDSISEGINILNEVIGLGGISKQERANTKIELADLYLLSDDVWEASLLYSQVEKEFKYDRLGEIAKLRNAKIAFYVGDFYWAQAQLDVLKGSTSKLISNDAMDLSLLITDNVGRDSIAEPLEMYAIADLMIFRKNYEDAVIIMDSINKFFPTNRLKDDILFTKYEINYKKREYRLAADNLMELIRDYGDDLLGDDALFYLAKLEEEKLGDKEKAMEHYKLLLTTYPSSLFVVESRKRFRNLRGDKLDEEIN